MFHWINLCCAKVDGYLRPHEEDILPWRPFQRSYGPCLSSALILPSLWCWLSWHPLAVHSCLWRCSRGHRVFIKNWVHVSKMVIIKHMGPIWLDIICPDSCLSKSVGPPISQIVKGLDQTIEWIPEKVLASITQSLVGYLSDKHVTFVPPGVDSN